MQMKKRLFHCTLAASVGLALAAVLLWLGAPSQVRAGPAQTTRYVASPPIGDDNGGANDCSMATSPCATIQHAIDVAQAYDEVHVADGVYTDTAGTVAVITDVVTIRGAYDPAAFGGPDPDLYETVLDAGRNGSVISITNATEAVLEHLTVTGGDGTGTVVLWAVEVASMHWTPSCTCATVSSRTTWRM